MIKRSLGTTGIIAIFGVVACASARLAGWQRQPRVADGAGMKAGMKAVRILAGGPGASLERWRLASV